MKIAKPSILNMYISKEILFSFLVSFLLFFVLFLVNQFLVMAEQILSRRVPFVEVGLLILFAMPSVIALTAPFATLIATLMASNRLNADNEILAMESLGIKKRKILIPFIFWGVIFTLTSFFVNDILMPVGHINYVRLLRSLIFRVPELELSPYTVRDYRDLILVTGDVKDGVVHDLLIFDRTTDNKFRSISAQFARLKESDEKAGIISIELYGNVMGIIPDQRIKENFEYFLAEKMVYNILLKDVIASASNPTAADMSSYDVWLEIQNKQRLLDDLKNQRKMNLEALKRELAQSYQDVGSQLKKGVYELTTLELPLVPILQRIHSETAAPIQDNTLVAWKYEFYQKFSIPISCILFSLIGFPLGLFSRKSGRMIGFGIGLIVSFLYWALLLGARRLSGQIDFDPWLIMFTPNILLIISGIILVKLMLKR